MTIQNSFIQWAEYVNAATTPQERSQRKQIAFPYLYGNAVGMPPAEHITGPEQEPLDQSAPRVTAVYGALEVDLQKLFVDVYFKEGANVPTMEVAQESAIHHPLNKYDHHLWAVALTAAQELHPELGRRTVPWAELLRLFSEQNPLDPYLKKIKPDTLRLTANRAARASCEYQGSRMHYLMMRAAMRRVKELLPDGDDFLIPIPAPVFDVYDVNNVRLSLTLFMAKHKES